MLAAGPAGVQVTDAAGRSATGGTAIDISGWDLETLTLAHAQDVEGYTFLVVARAIDGTDVSDWLAREISVAFSD